MKRTPRFFQTLLVMSIAVIASAILIFSFITYRKISRELNSLSRQMMLNQVITIRNSYNSLMDEVSGRLSSFMTLMEKEDVSSESIREVLDNFAAALVDCRHIWIIQRDGRIFMDSGTNRSYLERTDWWKEHWEMANLTGDDSYQGQFVVASASSEPYRDSMGLNTILPVHFLLLSGIHTTSMAFVELDLTSNLMRNLRDYTLVIMDREYPLEITIYDREGYLLESSANFYRSKVVVPNRNIKANIDFEDDRFHMGAVFVQDSKRVTVFTRETDLGLIFSGSLPKASITSTARNAAAYVLVIGLFCLISLLAFGLLLLQTYHKMKHYEDEQAAARFESLQNKMNPHFLFNTLDSLVGVAEKQDYPVLMDMLRHLSYILHMNLRITRDIIPLTDEIRYIESYISLQAIRYKKLFSFEMELPDEKDQLEILRFCLQPVVENCFVHGVALRAGFVAIKMVLRHDGHFLYCDVTNTGSRVTELQLDQLRGKLDMQWRGEKTRRLGLGSIHRRLKILYGEEYGIELMRTEDTFTVRIIFPALG